MKLFTITLFAGILVLALGACDQASSPETPDADCASLPPPERGPAALPAACLDGGVQASDARPATDTRPVTDTLVPRLEDALSGYVASGVYVNLGMNRCSIPSYPSKGGGWDPVHDKCYAPADNTVTSGVCGTYACGTYAPGTILVWDSVNPRFRYWTDPSGGVVCLPNDVPYSVPCT